MIPAIKVKKKQAEKRINRNEVNEGCQKGNSFMQLWPKKEPHSQFKICKMATALLPLQ